MKKKVSEATAEEILADVTSFEDMDASIIVSSTKDGGVSAMDYEGRDEVSASTFRDVLLAFDMYSRKRFNNPVWWDENRSLDWREESDNCNRSMET